MNVHVYLCTLATSFFFFNHRKIFSTVCRACAWVMGDLSRFLLFVIYLSFPQRLISFITFSSLAGPEDYPSSCTGGTRGKNIAHVLEGAITCVSADKRIIFFALHSFPHISPKSIFITNFSGRSSVPENVRQQPVQDITNFNTIKNSANITTKN
uniref:Uncharacterized protein n=1 Tax=Trypanosoma congolense (strain IL3000) TaxID=1068625 RepID=G0V1F2_TRYCI|nr:hypothetical protein, unlikely [Trypanosoma congolense IL3000]